MWGAGTFPFIEWASAVCSYQSNGWLGCNSCTHVIICLKFLKCLFFDPCRRHVVAKDSSGKGNDLSLQTPPFRGDVAITQGSNTLHTGKLEFKNNLAVNKQMKNMPGKSFTVEMWARGQKLTEESAVQVSGGVVMWWKG